MDKISSIFLLLFVSMPFLAVEGTADGNDGHHFNANHIGLFSGATSNLDAKHTYFTVGGDYEHRLGHLFGVGLLADFVFASHLETILGGVLFFHPIGSLKFLLAPAVELTEGHSVFVARAGLGYDFHLGNFSLTPTFNADLIKGHVSLVYGMAFGLGF